MALLPAGSSGHAASVDTWFGAGTLRRARVPAATLQHLALLAVVPMAAVSVGLALTSDHLQRPVATGLYFGYLTASFMAVGVYWWLRRPASRFGPLLVLFGVLAWIVSLESSDRALPFDIAVLIEGPYFWLTFYLLLAFPMGRLEPPATRWLMGALALGVVGFFLPWALFSPVIAGGGPLTRCAPNCPENVLQVGTAPHLVDVAGKAETYTGLAIAVCVVMVYVLRLVRATAPQRRSLMAIAATSLLFIPAWFVFNLSAWVLYLDQPTLDGMAWFIVAGRVLMPIGFLAALLQAERFAARASQRMIDRLAARPTPGEWCDTIATALDDTELRLGYFDPETGRYLDADATELQPAPPGAGRAWVPVEQDGRAVAAMDIDETLAEDPELVRVATSATLLAVENGDLEGELRASRRRILEAGNTERRRIERDLHDGTQQRLVALRIHLTLAGEQLVGSDQGAMLERLGVEVDEAIDALRSVARGVYPAVLTDMGVGAALRAAARHAAIEIRVDDGWRDRQPEVVETTVYFCCQESLQNVAKHAGRGASATVTLRQDAAGVGFVVEDDGQGFDRAAVEPGAGLTNLADRLSAVGGTLEVDGRPGRGTRITGLIPAAA